MSRSTLMTAAAVLFLFVAPAAGATWMSYGTYEPDTTLDEGFMFDDAPGEEKDRLYFNAFPKSMDVTNGANGAWVNPNVGALQTRIDAPGQMSFQALLGVWTDCNGDGYVGMLETAVREYKSEALLSSSLCPPVNDVTGISPATNWEAKGAHNNYNGWVTELIPIAGPDSTGSDSRVYSDPEAMVWGDSGKPGADWPEATPACGTRPSRTDDGSRSETRTTGGLLRAADCRGDRSVTLGGEPRSVSIIRNFNDADGTLGTGLGFGDPENAHTSSSPLNMGTFGSEDSSNTAVRAQDCNQAPLATTGDVPVGSDADNVPLVRPVPSDPVNGNAATWTIPGTLNYTRESITVAPKPGGGSDTAGDCNFANDRYHENGGDFYGAIEANPAVGFENGKRNAQWNFFFFSGQRGSLPSNAVRGGTAGASQDLGIEAIGAECRASSCAISQWDGGRITHTAPVTRGTLTDTSADGDETTIADAPHWTFYAHVGAASQRFTSPGGSGVYGSDQCGSETTGEHQGWNCDVSDWYKLADGSYTKIPLLGPPGRGFRPLAKVGQAYEFRDVDCLDGSLGATGLGVSPAFFGSGKCA